MERAVIADLDDSLAALLTRELPAAIATATALSFEAPDEHFPPSAVKLPAVDLFLYDVRENAELRTNEWIVERPQNGNLIRHPPPVRVDCSYLVTAWPSASGPSPARDEHRLLAEVLKVLVRFPTLPADVLTGELTSQAFPLPAVALGPGRVPSAPDLWRALNDTPKATLHLTVTLEVESAPPADAGPPVQERVFDIEQGRPPWPTSA